MQKSGLNININYSDPAAVNNLLQQLQILAQNEQNRETGIDREPPINFDAIYGRMDEVTRLLEEIERRQNNSAQPFRTALSRSRYSDDDGFNRTNIDIDEVYRILDELDWYIKNRKQPAFRTALSRSRSSDGINREPRANLDEVYRRMEEVARVLEEIERNQNSNIQSWNVPFRTALSRSRYSNNDNFDRTNIDIDEVYRVLDELDWYLKNRSQPAFRTALSRSSYSDDDNFDRTNIDIDEVNRILDELEKHLKGNKS